MLLLALLMQAISPYLPMPAMGGMTSWELAAARCPMHETGAGHKEPGKAPHDGPCSVCSVMQQASSTLASVEIALSCCLVSLPVDFDETLDTQTTWLAADVFSSRAPPYIG